MEKPATPETVLEQVVSGLNDDDMAAIGEQFFLRLRALPAFPGPPAGHTGPSQCCTAPSDWFKPYCALR